jgi:hypothetical protein
VFFPPPPRIVDLDLRVVADGWEELLAEKAAVVSEFRRFVAVAKPS